MKTEKEILCSVLKTTQMGQIGIRSALNAAVNQELRSAMESQLREYDAIETETQRIARQRNWQLQEINPSIRMMTDSMTRAKLSFGNRDSKIAAMMIHGNIKGVIKGNKNLNHATSLDEDIQRISGKLLETEEANVVQMKKFL